ncbi:MAG: hypothetical protein Q8P42_06105 [Gallionella sp.]|nr:hypothetical protein [Gallionella sp.]
MTDTKKPAQTGAERQRKYAAKKKLARDALRRAFHLARTAELLAKYQQALTVELKINPQSRYAKLCAQQIQELTARLASPVSPA